MSSMVGVSVDLSLQGGPDFSAVRSVLSTGYSVLEVKVDAGDTETVPFHAGSIADIALILITSSRYSTEDLSYQLSGETIALDAAQLFSGGGMLSRFGSDPDEITVTNGLDIPVAVTALVVRAA
jgi:hypothetical protein